MFGAMFKKEWTASLRSFKLFSVLVVFAILGIMSPLVALFTPEIIGSVVQEQMPGFELPEPTAYDSFVQFYSNVNQMGLLIFVIVFGSVLTVELTSGTLVNLLTKSLSRSIVVHVKALFMLIVWTVSYVLAAGITYLYTIYYWDEPLHQLFGALFTPWLYGVFLIALILLASVVFKNFIVVLSTLLIVITLFMVIGIHPDIAEWLPNYMVRANVELLQDAKPFSDLWKSIWVTVGSIVVMYVVTIFRFKKMEV